VSAARLLICADDYGYSPRYNRGILEAVEAAAIDAAGVMVCRPWCDPAPLIAGGVEVGLHLEERGEGPADSVGAQADRFERLFGFAPAFVDGHHHCHGRAPLEAPATELAAELGVRVRSIDAEHRARLRDAGIETPDRLIGRLSAAEPLVPREVAHVEGGGEPAPGFTEWMVHPGLADPAAGSSFDAAREQDLDELLRLARDEVLRRWRGAA
jgi:predicted glycoside hydrolase/deacetylase ChbG (UPF0249 family)